VKRSAFEKVDSVGALLVQKLFGEVGGVPEPAARSGG